MTLRSGSASRFTAFVHHLGRRSPKRYAAPVAAHQTQDDVIVPLPQGTDVDWLHNLRAAGQGVIDLGGRSLEVDKPAVVDMVGGFQLWTSAAPGRTLDSGGCSEVLF